MSAWQDDPFEVLVVEEQQLDEFSELSRRDILAAQTPAAVPSAAATARLHGFDLDERPLVVGLPELPYEIVPARTTVGLLREHIGATVVLVFDQGDVRRPIVIGVLQDARVTQPGVPTSAPVVSAHVDDQQIVLTAEREIVLRCGQASITLTRAGKVLIKGTYVLSRSSGYNKIKGAAVDIN